MYAIVLKPRTVCLSEALCSYSWINDSMGVRTSLMVGFVCSFGAIICLATASSAWMVYTVLFGLLPLGKYFML
jgi:hypothetical protein